MSESAAATGKFLTQLAQAAQVGLERQRLTLMSEAQTLNKKRLKHQISRDSSMDPLVRTRISMETEKIAAQTGLAEREQVVAEDNSSTNKLRVAAYVKSVDSTDHYNLMDQLRTEFKNKVDLSFLTDTSAEAHQVTSSEYLNRYTDTQARITAGEIGNTPQIQQQLASLLSSASFFSGLSIQVARDKAREDAAKLAAQGQESKGLVETGKSVIDFFRGESGTKPKQKTLPKAAPQKKPTSKKTKEKSQEQILNDLLTN